MVKIKQLLHSMRTLDRPVYQYNLLNLGEMPSDKEVYIKCGELQLIYVRLRDWSSAVGV